MKGAFPPGLKDRVKKILMAVGLLPTPPAEVTVRVGRFDLLMARDNPLNGQFVAIPEYSSQLGRLVAEVRKKHPDAGLIDVGANVGDTLALAKTAADLPVVCVEGDPDCFRYLERNVRQFPDASAHQVYLGEHTGPVSVVVEKAGRNSTLVPAQGEEATVLDLVSLDDFVASFDASRYRILKIDAEGFDTRILRGGRSYLSDVRPAVMFEYNRNNMSAIGEDGLSALTYLGELGYRTALFHDAFGRFVLSLSLQEKDLVRHMHEYADGFNSPVKYFDICAFHAQDEALAQAFVETEVEHRRLRSWPLAGRS